MRTPFLRDRRGSAALEFALVGGIFMVLLLGTLEAARFQITLQSLRSLAADAARAGLISANQSLGGGGCAVAVNQATLLARTPMLSATPLTLSVVPDCGARTITAQVSYDFAFVVSIMPDRVLTQTAILVF